MIAKYKLKNGFEISVSPYLYSACQDGTLTYDKKIASGGRRLDHYAYDSYGRSDMWWVIAACSGIGWPLQVPDGVLLIIPNDIEQLDAFISEI